MKKALFALLTVSSAAFATTATTVVDGNITLDGTQAADTRLDFTYSTTPNQVVTTTANTVTIEGSDGYGLNVENTTVTANVQYQLVATGNMKLATGANGTIIVNTAITQDELLTLKDSGEVSRYVITADIFNNVASKNVSLTLAGMDGYANGGVIFHQATSGKYYALSDISFAGDYASVKAGATALELADGTVYTTLKITADGGASVKGIGFVATAITETVPEPATATLSLLALAGLAARRRRK